MRGLGLIELVMVLALFGIFFALLVHTPFFSHTEYSRMDRDTVLSALLFARNRAHLGHCTNLPCSISVQISPTSISLYDTEVHTPIMSLPLSEKSIPTSPTTIIFSREEQNSHSLPKTLHFGDIYGIHIDTNTNIQSFTTYP